jgi:hypothetical protein
LGPVFSLETHEGHNILVTNRHILDPRRKLGPDTAFCLARCSFAGHSFMGSEVASGLRQNDVGP